MARRRALGRALTGFAENFLPAWQSMQYMDRLRSSDALAEKREERLRRRDAQRDVAAMQTGMRSEFAPESDVAQNVLEIMANNPGVFESADDVTAMLTGSLATTPERFGAMGANLTPDQIASMTPAVVRARASRAGFDMDQWDKPGALTPEGQIPSEGFVGYTAMPPGQEGLADLRQEPTQILPGPLTDEDVLASIQKTAPTVEQLFGGITPTQDLGEESLAAQFGDYQTQQGEWGAEIAEQAHQRELGQTADAVTQDVLLRNDLDNQINRDRIERLRQEQTVVGDVASNQAVDEYERRLEAASQNRAKWWNTESSQEARRQVTVFEAMDPLERQSYKDRLVDEHLAMVERLPDELHIRSVRQYNDDTKRFEEPYVQAQARANRTIVKEEALAREEVKFAGELERLDPAGEFSAAFLANRELINDLDRYTAQGPPSFAIEFDPETKEPVASLALTRTREGAYRYDRQDGFYPLLHPDYMRSKEAGLSLDQMLRLGVGSTEGVVEEPGGQSLDEMAAGKASVLWEDPTERPTPPGGWHMVDGQIYTQPEPWMRTAEAGGGLGISPHGLPAADWYGQLGLQIDTEIASVQGKIQQTAADYQALAQGTAPAHLKESYGAELQNKWDALRSQMTQLITQRATLSE